MADLARIGKVVVGLVHVGGHSPAVEVHGSQVEPRLSMRLQSHTAFDQEMRAENRMVEHKMQVAEYAIRLSMRLQNAFDRDIRMEEREIDSHE